MNISLAPHPKGVRAEDVVIPADSVLLEGELDVPRGATAVVICAHAGGGGRHSPRHQFLGRLIRDAGLGTLLLDLLAKGEAPEDPSAARDGVGIAELAERLASAVRWLDHHPSTSGLVAGLFGSGVAGAAALVAAAGLGGAAGAVVVRDGRVELVRAALSGIVSPTLLIAGGEDELLAPNREAARALRCEKDLQVVPGATQLFDEPGETERVGQLAAEWFGRHLET